MTDGFAFEGDRKSLDHFLRSVQGFYVYVLCRPGGTPFYVGKGTKRRALEHELEALRHHPFGETNPIKCNVIRKLHRSGAGVLYRVDSVFAPVEQQACLAREAALIGRYRRLHEGGCLTNLAGGLGSLAGSAPSSLAKHGATLSGAPVDNPDRATMNRFLQAIGPVASVPIKPVGQLGRLLPTTPHPNARRPTARTAYALVASAAASGILLTDGGIVPRAFNYCGVDAIIENGVARYILKAGLASLIAAADPRHESFSLSPAQVRLVEQLVGRETLLDRGLV